MGGGGGGGGVENRRLKLTSANVEVEVEAELGKKETYFHGKVTKGILVRLQYYGISHVFICLTFQMLRKCLLLLFPYSGFY